MEQVIPIRKPEQTINSMLESFHREYELNSKATAKAYKTDVSIFIKAQAPYGLDTSLEQVPDFINYDSVSSFRNKERRKKLSAGTINRRLSAIKEFAKHLKFRGVDLDITFFDGIKPLKGEPVSYEVISITEALQIAEWVKENEPLNSKMKYYYILLAIDTGIRAEALSQLTPKNFVELDDTVIIRGVDKGQKRFNKHISKDLFQEIKDNLAEWGGGNQPLFPFTAKNRADIMRRALKGLGWENRNIAFHSFKKVAVNGAFETTGDIRIAMTVGAHSSIATTQRYLANEGEDFLGAISNGNLKAMKNLDYNDFSKEELIRAVEEMSKNFQYQFKNNLINNQK